MCLAFIDLSAAEVIDLVVAAGTAALAIGTFSMARATKKMAVASEIQAELSRSQLEIATTPSLRVVRIGQPSQADMVTVNESSDSEALVLHLENRGTMPAEVGYIALLPGGEGRIVDHDEMSTPAIERGQDREFEFFPTPADKQAIRGGGEVVLRAQFNGIPTLVASALVAKLRCELDDDGNERWLVLAEEPARPVRTFPSPDELHVDP